MPLLLVLSMTLGLQNLSVLDLPKAQIITEVHRYSQLSVRQIAIEKAKKYNLNQKLFLNTIKCESDFIATSTGDYPDGKGNFVPEYLAPKGAEPTSFGVAQLHFPERDWGISTSTAENPEVALEIMAKAWSKGQENKWSCWRQLYS